MESSGPGGDPPPPQSDRSGGGTSGKDRGSDNRIEPLASLSAVPPSSSIAANLLASPQQILGVAGQATDRQSNIGTAVPLLLQNVLDSQRLRSNETAAASSASTNISALEQRLVLDAANQRLESLIGLREQERLLASAAATARAAQAPSAPNSFPQTELERLLQLVGDNRLASSLSPQISPALSQDQQLLLLLQRQRDAEQAQRNALLAASLRQEQLNQIPLARHLQASAPPPTQRILLFPPGMFSSAVQNLPTSSLSMDAAQVLTGPNIMNASPATGLHLQNTLASARSSSVDNAVEAWRAKGSAGRKRPARDTELLGTEPDQGTAKRKKREYKHESFPVKLHRLLRETEAEGKQDIISFSGNGTEVSVHNASRFEKEILPKYFRHNKLSSFRRLLNMYGFERLRNGADGGTFRHPSFLKTRPDLCATLERVR